MVGSGSDNDPGSVSLIIVGIGASAGGIQALKEFFELVTPDSGMGYVVILHLSPDYDSKLSEVLQLVAKIPVIQVVGKVQVEADRIYVISPNHHLTMSDGYFIASENLICRFLKGQDSTRDIPVIIVSASPHLDEQAKAAGADDFIEKPFQMKSMLELLKKYI